MRKEIFSVLAASMAFCAVSAADAAAVISLPEPDKDGGKPLMKVLTQRKTQRKFKKEEIPLQKISSLLYAAWGINRPEEGKRTIPTAMNRQNLEVYVLFPAGCYRYDAKSHALVLVKKGDLRGKAFMRPEMPLSAAFVLIYVGKDAGMPMEYSCAHAGAAYQNVYLYCASEGLAAVICAGFDKKAMASAMELPQGANVLFSQLVGVPAE